MSVKGDKSLLANLNGSTPSPKQATGAGGGKSGGAGGKSFFCCCVSGYEYVRKTKQYPYSSAGGDVAFLRTRGRVKF